MKKTNIIIDVASVKLLDKQLFYCFKNGNLILRDEIIISNVETDSYWLKDEYLYFHSKEGHHYIFNIYSKNQTLLNCGLIWFTIKNHNSFCSYDLDISEDTWKWKTGLIDLEKNTIIKEFPKLNSTAIAFFLNTNFLVCYLKNNRLGGFSLQTGSYHWEVDLGVYISSVLGVFANKLWIYTGTNELISLALDTGQILQRIRSHDFHPNVSDSGFVAYAVHFEEQHGRITFLEHRTYVEFDLATCQVIRQKSFDRGNPQADWAFSVNSLDDNYCYFVGNQGRDAGFAQWVGVLNRATLEVEWSEHLGKLNPKKYWVLNKAPLSDGSKLYVHDSEGTLHIFEKTEDN